jgi:Phosphoribosyltransferase
VGAGPLPVGPAHARVLVRPLDVAAMDAARAAGLAEPAVWLAGCCGRPHVRARLTMVEAAGGPAEPLPAGDVAAAVDAGRAFAAASGATVLAVEIVGRHLTIPASALAAALSGRPPDVVARGGDAAAVRELLERRGGDVRGPLSALRRLGGEALARVCGMALGAGEHGLAFVADGLGAAVAAAAAVRIQPELAPRVRLAGAPATAAERALELPALVEDPAGAEHALAVLRRTSAGVSAAA